MSLGTAYAVDYGLQFLLPVVLTRALDPQSFGEYRLLWLAVSTLLIIAPMCMPQSLYYFLPRSEGDRKRLYLNQTVIFMVVAGLASGSGMSVACASHEAFHSCFAHGLVVFALALAGFGLGRRLLPP